MLDQLLNLSLVQIIVAGFLALISGPLYKSMTGSAPGWGVSAVLAAAALGVGAFIVPAGTPVIA